MEYVLQDTLPMAVLPEGSNKTVDAGEGHIVI